MIQEVFAGDQAGVGVQCPFRNHPAGRHGAAVVRGRSRSRCPSTGSRLHIVHGSSEQACVLHIQAAGEMSDPPVSGKTSGGGPPDAAPPAPPSETKPVEVIVCPSAETTIWPTDVVAARHGVDHHQRKRTEPGAKPVDVGQGQLRQARETQSRDAEEHHAACYAGRIC